jgi:hypothetical protein
MFQWLRVVGGANVVVAVVRLIERFKTLMRREGNGHYTIHPYGQFVMLRLWERNTDACTASAQEGSMVERGS